MHEHRERVLQISSRFLPHSRIDRAASLVEYALLVALIAIVCFLAVAFFGGETGDTFSRVGDSVSSS